MNTYKPLLDNLELKKLCDEAYKNAPTPLQQTNLALKNIENLRSGHKPKANTTSDRVKQIMAQKIAALKKALDNR